MICELQWLSIFHCSRSAVLYASSITNFHLSTEILHQAPICVKLYRAPRVRVAHTWLELAAPGKLSQRKHCHNLAKWRISHQSAAAAVAIVLLWCVVGSPCGTPHSTRPVERVAEGGIDDRLANHNCSGRFVATLINGTSAARSNGASCRVMSTAPLPDSVMWCTQCRNVSII